VSTELLNIAKNSKKEINLNLMLNMRLIKKHRLLLIRYHYYIHTPLFIAAFYILSRLYILKIH